MPGGGKGKADLTWQDASAAFQLAAGGSALAAADYGAALAMCGMVKYGTVPGFGPQQQVEGFLANLSGAKDEHAVIPGGV